MRFATRSCGNHGLRVGSVIKTTRLDAFGRVFIVNVVRDERAESASERGGEGGVFKELSC